MVDDALLTLSFLTDSEHSGEFKVTLSDTWMLSKEVPPQTKFDVPDIVGEKHEHVTAFKLEKGRHYALTVYYLGTAQGQSC